MSGKFDNWDEYGLSAFEEAFIREIDSWFSADIACCGKCYDDFVKTWPGAYFITDEFQKNYTELRNFYDGSRLRNHYTEAQFWKYVRQLNCPNCDESLEADMILYELPFSPPVGIENRINNLKTFIEETPFLALRNELAEEVYELLSRLHSESNEEEISGIFYRGRTVSDYTPVAENLLPPPPNKQNEGRYNHAGKPVVYLASSEKTCYYELRMPVEHLWIAKCKLNLRGIVLDLLDEDEEMDDLLKAIIYSALTTSPEEGDGWNKPQYYFTRFIADCCKQLGFVAIRYPSVRRTSGTNLVLLNPIALSETQIEEVYPFVKNFNY